ncbi:hypothetical protein A7C99_1740 [Trichophyton rubrum]|uniref:Protein kinase domain-containing protein n=1 Tax=Trichophyton rubrum TaxID=5551 RepID=A0A178F2W6_TRIRU|nr:hypothetical protein A7C99_1720 [Trichophyton rubrum]OAL66355.1 hypothetical protein A7C99_1740 [Trichophyton rubrum]
MGERESDECPPTPGNGNGNVDIEASPVPIFEFGGNETCFWGKSKMVPSSFLTIRRGGCQSDAEENVISLRIRRRFLAISRRLLLGFLKVEIKTDGWKEAPSPSGITIAFHYADALHKHNWLGGDAAAYVYHVSPTIAVKTIRLDLSDPEKEWLEEHQLAKDIAFYKRLNERQDRCPHEVECSLILPDHLFLSICSNGAIEKRYYKRQERENDHLFGRLLRLTSALEYVEKMGYCHNDPRSGNCLLDARLNLKLTDFGCATTIGQYLEYTGAPWAARVSGGPLQGIFGLCSARTEQFALGSMVYFLVYGHEPHEEKSLEEPELIRRFDGMKLPEMDHHEIFDGLIWGFLGRKEDEPEVMTITDQTTEAGICEFGFAGGYWEQNWRFASSRCGGGIYMPRGAVLSHTGTS